jgi:hypothetical protein
MFKRWTPHLAPRKCTCYGAIDDKSGHAFCDCRAHHQFAHERVSHHRPTVNDYHIATLSDVDGVMQHEVIAGWDFDCQCRSREIARSVHALQANSAGGEAGHAIANVRNWQVVEFLDEFGGYPIPLARTNLHSCCPYGARWRG